MGRDRGATLFLGEGPLGTQAFPGGPTRPRVSLKRETEKGSKSLLWRTCEHHGCHCSSTIPGEQRKGPFVAPWPPRFYFRHFLTTVASLHKQPPQSSHFRDRVFVVQHIMKYKVYRINWWMLTLQQGQQRSKCTPAFIPASFCLPLLFPFAETTLSRIQAHSTNRHILSKHMDQNLLLRERRLVPTCQRMLLNRLK